MLFPSMTGPIHPVYIDDAHPLHDKKSVIIKFSNRWVKNEVMRCKNDLIGTGLKVTEHLTPYTLELVSSAEKIVGPSNVWVYNTLVFARFGNTRYSIRTAHDLDVLYNAVNKPEVPIIPQPSNDTNLRNGKQDVSTDKSQISAHTQEQLYRSILTPNTSDYDITPGLHDATYNNNYPALFNSMFYRNNTKTSTLRGRPSRNGRGAPRRARGNSRY